MKSQAFFLYLFFLCLFVCGCHHEKWNECKKIQIKDFTVCEKIHLPEELKILIDEKKEKPFFMSYTNSMYTYIVKGYGKQKAGEYVVALRSLEETKKEIYLECELIHIRYAKEKPVGEQSTYPFLAVRIFASNKMILPKGNHN